MITNSLDEAMLLSDRIVPMSRGPLATLGTAVEVAMPRPRTPEMLAHDESALRVRSRVIEALTASIDRADALQPSPAHGRRSHAKVHDATHHGSGVVSGFRRTRSEA
jgi:nitrate/nitrite transport system ATP-binding protein